MHARGNENDELTTTAPPSMKLMSAFFSAKVSALMPASSMEASSLRTCVNALRSSLDLTDTSLGA